MENTKQCLLKSLLLSWIEQSNLFESKAMSNTLNTLFLYCCIRMFKWMTLLPLSFHKSAVEPNTPVLHSAARVGLILRWAMCFLWSGAKDNWVSWGNKGKDSAAVRWTLWTNVVFTSVPSGRFVFQFSSLWICYQSAHWIIFSPLPRSFHWDLT